MTPTPNRAEDFKWHPLVLYPEDLESDVGLANAEPLGNGSIYRNPEVIYEGGRPVAVLIEQEAEGRTLKLTLTRPLDYPIGPRKLTPADVAAVHTRTHKWTIPAGIEQLRKHAAHCLKLYPILPAGPISDSREMPSAEVNQAVKNLLPTLRRIRPETYDTWGIAIMESSDRRRVAVTVAGVVFHIWLVPTITGGPTFFQKVPA